MHPAVYSQAERIARGDQDLRQNILAMTFQNTQNAESRGRHLSIGEQVNFMKYRAGNLRSGKRHAFGHGLYKATQDVYNRHLYFLGELEIYRIHYEDQAGNDEEPGNGRGSITGILANTNPEDRCLFAVDLESFITGLPANDRHILLQHLAGFSFKEIGVQLNCSGLSVRKRFREISARLARFMGIEGERN